MANTILAKQLALVCPHLARESPEKLEVYARALTIAMIEAQITSVTRIAAFLGQVCLESYEFKYTRELWDPNKVPVQSTYERDFDQPYPPTTEQTTSRTGNYKAFRLGNSEEGDGFRFRGWGPMQITGRGNTLKCSTAIYGDARLVDDLKLLDDPSIGIRGAAWYWSANSLNVAADMLDYVQVTKVVNGGTTHHDRRMAYYYRALEVFGRDVRYLNSQVEPA